MSEFASDEAKPKNSRLIVRVKRKRDQPPASSIFLFSSGGDASVGTGVASKKRRKILESSQSLQRLHLDNAQCDGHPSSSSGTCGSEHVLLLRSHTVGDCSASPDHHLQASTNCTNIEQKFMLRRQRSLPSSQDSGTLVIDLQQVTAYTNVEASSGYTERNTGKCESGPIQQLPRRILNPVSRFMERGIILAVSKGDFSELSSALIKGGSPCYQVANDQNYLGYTALMAASSRGNVQLVQRLLMRIGASDEFHLYTRNAQGNTARDLVCKLQLKSSPRSGTDNHVAVEIIKLFDEAEKRLSKGSFNHFAGGDIEYVYDVFEVANAEKWSSYCAGKVACSSDISSATEAVHIPVSGLRVATTAGVTTYSLDNQGREEMMYDSEWSDLGDDEDPDSNDERFAGNDYPEEEDDSDGTSDTSYNDCHQRFRTLRLPEDFPRGYGLDINGFNSRQPVGRVVHAYDYNESENMESFPDDKRYSQHSQTSRGECVPGNHCIETCSISREVHESDAQKEFLMEQNYRLPKYGTNLSDDEYEATMLYSERDWKPNSCLYNGNFVSVAYDSELDSQSDK